MKTVTISCWGANLVVVPGLAAQWPHHLPLAAWPTYCGAGDGIGDKIVPDTVRGVCLSPACIAHDIEWALAPSRNGYYFVTGNYHFWLNMRSLMQAAIPKKEKRRYKMAMRLCNLYAFAVTSPIGWRCFNPEGTTVFELNQDVQGKLRRLDVAATAYSSPKARSGGL